MCENAFSAYKRLGRPHGPKAHDGTTKKQRVNEMLNTDMTATLTVAVGNAAISYATDHCSLELVGIHAAKHVTRFEALAPVRQGVRATVWGFRPGRGPGTHLVTRPRQLVRRRQLSAGDRFLGFKDFALYACAPRATAAPNALTASSRKIFSVPAASEPPKNYLWRFWLSRSSTTGCGGLADTVPGRPA